MSGIPEVTATPEEPEAAIAAILARTGLPVSDEERERLVRLYPLIKERSQQLRMIEALRRSGNGVPGPSPRLAYANPTFSMPGGDGPPGIVASVWSADHLGTLQLAAMRGGGSSDATHGCSRPYEAECR